MKRILLALCISAVAFPAAAIQRYNIQTMSCSAVQQAVQRDGAVILRWRSALTPSVRSAREVASSAQPTR